MGLASRISTTLGICYYAIIIFNIQAFGIDFLKCHFFFPLSLVINVVLLRVRIRLLKFIDRPINLVAVFSFIRDLFLNNLISIYVNKKLANFVT